MNIILASQSPSRRSLLERTGIKFGVFHPDVDENPLQNSDKSAEFICLELAKKKAQVAFEAHPDSIIIASDQLVSFDKKVYGKAFSPKKACQTLETLQGKTHQLINGLYMIYKKESLSHVSINHMHMRPLSKNQIKKYVEIENPLHSAGSYYVERSGLALFKKIETTDYSSIIGLPIAVVVNQLIKWNVPYLE